VGSWSQVILASGYPRVIHHRQQHHHLLIGSWGWQKGQGVGQDAGEACKWYRTAADKGDSTAQTNLGRCFRDGIGVTPNLDEATK
jgi:TPR repeat protein